MTWCSSDLRRSPKTRHSFFFFSFNPQYPQQPLRFWAWSTNPKNSLASLKHPENSQIHNNQFVAPIVEFFLWVWDEKGEKKRGKKRKRKRENPETEWKGMGKKNATKPRNLMWKGGKKRRRRRPVWKENSPNPVNKKQKTKKKKVKSCSRCSDSGSLRVCLITKMLLETKNT